MLDVFFWWTIFMNRPRWDRRLQPDARWTPLHGHHICNSQWQTVSSLDITVSARTFLQSRQHVSWQQRHWCQQPLSKPRYELWWRSLVLYNGSWHTLGTMWRARLWSVSVVYSVNLYNLYNSPQLFSSGHFYLLFCLLWLSINLLLQQRGFSLIHRVYASTVGPVSLCACLSLCLSVTLVTLRYCIKTAKRGIT